MNSEVLKIVEDCRADVEQSVKNSNHNKYDYKIIYISLTDDDQIQVSYTPHLLGSTRKCFLIHRWMQVAVTIYYETFLVQSVNNKGEVQSGRIDEDFSFNITKTYPSESNVIELYFRGKLIYREKISFKDEDFISKISFVWQLYKKCRFYCRTQYECELIGQLAMQEKTIESLNEKLEGTNIQKAILEDEMSHYLSILDEIKRMLDRQCP